MAGEGRTRLGRTTRLPPGIKQGFRLGLKQPLETSRERDRIDNWRALGLARLPQPVGHLSLKGVVARQIEAIIIEHQGQGPAIPAITHQRQSPQAGRQSLQIAQARQPILNPQGRQSLGDARQRQADIPLPQLMTQQRDTQCQRRLIGAAQPPIEPQQKLRQLPIDGAPHRR